MTETPSHDRAPDEAAASHSWLNDRRIAHRIYWVVIAVCALLFLADAFYNKHTIFEFEGWFGFFGLFGFSVSFALVLAAREMRKILMRDEDYYDR